jgi:perosamine synthetase
MTLSLPDVYVFFVLMVFTRDPKCFSSLTSDLRPPTSDFSWFYEMTDLGYNYRITDFQCALGISQLKKLPNFLKRRREIAAQYDKAFFSVSEIEPLLVKDDIVHAYHLYVVQIDYKTVGTDRTAVFQKMKEKGIGVNVHYVPVHLHPFYQKRFGTEPGICPIAEEAYKRILSLPIFPGMFFDDVKIVIEKLIESVKL